MGPTRAHMGRMLGTMWGPSSDPCTVAEWGHYVPIMLPMLGRIWDHIGTRMGPI
jgi:hypothetical protein